MSSQFVPCIIIGIPHAVSTFSTARRISALLSVSVLPHSLVIESASSSRCCSSSVFSRNSGCTRSTTGVRRHSINARCATSTAAFTSAAGDSGTSANTAVDAGLITFRASLALDPRHSPSMKFCKRSISSPPVAFTLLFLFPDLCHPERTGPQTIFSLGVVSRETRFCFSSPALSALQKIPFPLARLFIAYPGLAHALQL